MPFTPGQARTARALLAFLGVFAVLSVVLLGWEFYSLFLEPNQQATISVVVRLLYYEEPGAFMTAGLLTAFSLGTLNGHFFWCKGRT